MKGPTNWDVLLVFLLTMATIVFLAILVFEQLEDIERVICVIDPVAGERLHECDGPLP